MAARVFDITGHPAVYGKAGLPSVYRAGLRRPIIRAPSVATAESELSFLVSAFKTALATGDFEAAAQFAVAFKSQQLQAEAVAAPVAEAIKNALSTGDFEALGAPIAASSPAKNTSATFEAVAAPVGEVQPGTPNFMQMIEAVGAQSGIQRCWDAGDINSYPGSGSLWNDLSGAGGSWARSGTGGGPTFVGTAGGLSSGEYFRFNGSNYFAQGGWSFADDWHKNNGVFTVAGACRVISGGGNFPVFATAVPTSNSNNQRIQIRLSLNNGAVNLVVAVVRGTGNALLENLFQTDYSDVSIDCFWSVALDESVGANGIRFRFNELVQKYDSTYSSPSSSDPVGDYLHGRQVQFSNGTIATNAPDNARSYVLAAWNRKLTDQEDSDLYDIWKTRPGFEGLP